MAPWTVERTRSMPAFHVQHKKKAQTSLPGPGKRLKDVRQMTRFSWSHLSLFFLARLGILPLAQALCRPGDTIHGWNLYFPELCHIGCVCEDPALT